MYLKVKKGTAQLSGKEVKIMKRKLIFLPYLFSILFILVSLCETNLYALSVKDISQITYTPNDMESDLNWSPDANKIAFSQFRGSSMLDEVAVVNRDGSNYQKLTFDPSSDGYPVWSTDGSKIAFISSRTGPGNTFWLMNSDGSDQHQISNFGDVYHYIPVWTSDGTRLIFRSQHEGVSNLYSMDIDGSNLMKLTFFSYSVSDFSYSPKNEKIILIVSNAEFGGNNDIWIMNADGSDQQQLTFNSLFYKRVVWSPDGGTIAYAFGNQLYLMDSEGGNHRLLYQFPNGNSSFPCWSPSRKYITLRLYDPNDIGNYYSLWVMKVDGTDLTRIISGGYIEDVAWSPMDENTIAFSFTNGRYTTSPQNDVYIAILNIPDQT